MISEFLEDNFVIVILLLIALLIWFLYRCDKNDTKQYNSFISECVQYHKNYECVAMWRAGEKAPAAVPVVVPVMIH